MTTPKSCCAGCAIRDLISLVAQQSDYGTAESYAQLFTPDAVWSSPAIAATGKGADYRVGRDEIAEGSRQRRAQRIHGPGTATRHVVTTVSVNLQGADVASASSYWMFYVDTTSTPRLASMGRYDDLVVRTDDGWRIARRIITPG